MLLLWYIFPNKAVSGKKEGNVIFSLNLEARNNELYDLSLQVSWHWSKSLSKLFTCLCWNCMCVCILTINWFSPIYSLGVSSKSSNLLASLIVFPALQLFCCSSRALISKNTPGLLVTQSMLCPKCLEKLYLNVFSDCGDLWRSSRNYYILRIARSVTYLNGCTN